jgi:RNA polymerase sigma factor (sigma-70 family)
MIRPMSAPAPAHSTHQDLALRDRCLVRPPDRAAWNELWRLHAPLVRARVLYGRRAFPDADVEDIVQLVFLRLAEGALARYEGRASLRGYILTLADSLRISENRRRLALKRGAGRVESLDDLTGEEGSGGERRTRGALRIDPTLASAPRDPEMLDIERRRREAVRWALERLDDPRDRDVVALYFGDDACVDREISERLGMPLNTVTWRRLKALRELRRHLDPPEVRR